jgi:hypothetical protein
MKANLSLIIFTVRQPVGALFILSGLFAQGADKANSVDAFPNFESYVKISGQAAAVTGSDSTFQNRTRRSADGGVGIEDLHIVKDLSKTTTATIEGRALVGSEDYLGRINIAKADLGSIDFGFKRFRTFYDGIGGFFPLNRQWMPLTNQDLHIDRSKFWIEAKIALKDRPEFEVRYTNELRSGKKDSTIWGDSDLTGLAFNLAPNPVSPVRKFIPSYVNIGERHQNFEATIKHLIGKTGVKLTLIGDTADNSNTRYVTRFPGEVIPWSIASLPTAAQPAAKAAVAPINWNNQQSIAQNDAYKTKTAGINASSETSLTEKLTLRINAGYELIHTEIGGGRPLITSTATAVGVVSVITDNYQGLYGGTRLKNYSGSIALDYKATKTIFVKVALKGQSEFIRSASGYTVVAASGTPAVNLTSTPRLDWSKIHQNERTPVLELRYTGIKDLALYFNGSKRDLSGEEKNTSSYNFLTAASGALASNHLSEDHNNYTLGGNWRQSSFMTIRGEFFQKEHKNSSIGYATRVGDYYLLDSNYAGYKLTTVARVSAEIGFTTRYINQRGKMQVTGFLPSFSAYDSLDSKNHMISESIDWNPNKSCYFQVNANLVYNKISTVYPRAGVTPATSTLSAFDTNRVLQNSNNDYVTLGALSGFVLNKSTDLEFQANQYRADNGNAVLASMTMPYGVSVKETSVTVGMKHKISKTWLTNAKVGYFNSKNDTTGGLTNFSGPVAYVAFEHGI